MNPQLTRSDFLRTSARVTASLAVLGTPLLRPGRAYAAPLVRQDVGGLTASSPAIVSYAKAVTAMKALPATDPVSWAYQAAIHGTTVGPPQIAWNTCEHHTLFFWSWHRMYLYYFERIVRKLSGDATFALPYWNYGSATQRQLPPMFRDAASPLYTANRGAGWNSGASSLPGWAVSSSSGMGLVDYALASDSLESSPHDNVHVQLGGLMGSVPTAAQDPIFYLHHCNVDRLWNLWLAQGGGRTDPLSNVPWRTNKYTFFDENGAQVQLTGCNVVRAAAQLNYGYEGEPAQVAPYCFKVLPPWIFKVKLLFRWPNPPYLLSLKPQRVRVDIAKFREQLAAAARSKTETLLVRLDDVVAAKAPGAVWQVFLAPSGVSDLNPDGPFFVGTVALFGTGLRSGAHHFTPATFTFPADRAVEASLRSRNSAFTLTFVAQGPLVNGKPSRARVASTVRVGTTSMLVQTQQRR